MKCAKENNMYEEMRAELVNDGYAAEELTEFEVLDLWLEACQAYHKELRGVVIKRVG